MIRSVIVLLIVCAGIQAGCQGTTAQGTLYSIQPNRGLSTFLAADLETVHEAAVEVVKNDFGYEIEEEALDAREGIIRARTARDRMVRVETFMHSQRVTRIVVYAGGSEPLARDLLDKIETRVK